MNYVLFFLLLLCMCAWRVLSCGGVVGMVFWTYLGLSPLALAIAYATGRAGILGKQPTGGRSSFARVAFAPYWLLNSLLASFARVAKLVAGPQEVATGLWVGPRLLGPDRRNVPRFAGVIDMTAEFEQVAFLRIGDGYACFPVLDGTSPSREQFVQAIRLGVELAERGPLYVHCASGHGRSVAVLAGIMVASGRADCILNALLLIRSKRPRALPTARQIRTLSESLDGISLAIPSA